MMKVKIKIYPVKCKSILRKTMLTADTVKYFQTKLKSYFTGVIFLVLIFLGLFGLAESSVAATYYCTPTGSGNLSGSSWSNACAFNSTTPVRGASGNTYYLAEGNYNSKSFNSVGSASTYITLKKCPTATLLADACQGVTGWADSMGDSQAVFGSSGSYGLDLGNNSGGQITHFIIDGMTGGGPDAWTSNLGIKLNRVRLQNASYITIRHAEITADRTGPENNENSCNNARPLYTDGLSNLTMQYCYIHNAADDMWTVVGTTNTVLVEYSKWAFSYQSAACHPDLAQMYGGSYSNIVWRYNYIYALKVTYLWGVHNGFTVNNYEIYGNIVEFTPPGVFDSSTSDGVAGNIDHGGGDTGTFNGLKFYNNTIIGDWSYNMGFGNPNLTPGSNLYAYNNIWVKLSQSGGNGYGGWGGVTHSDNTGYNTATLGDATTTGNPFVDSTNKNFRLTGATAAGKSNLGSPYNVDMYGNARGADGVWDRGAIEYAAGGSDTTAPGAPSGLTVQ